MSTAFVTGGSGLIGSALVRRLIADGHEVVALARSLPAERVLTGLGARPVRGELLDEAALAGGMAGCDLVFNVAGVNSMCPTDPAHMLAVNVDGAAAVTRAAAQAGVKRLVHTSSAASIGEAGGVVATEDTPHRGSYLSLYERSKHLSEGAVAAAAAGTGLEVVTVNPSSVQGPGRAGGTGKFLIAYLNGRLRVFVETTLSLVDIQDCVEGHVRAAERGTPGRRYLISGAALPVSEAFAIAGRIAGVHGDPRILPPVAAQVGGAVVEAGAKLLRRKPPVCRAMVRTLLHGHHYDGSRATRELGLTYTPIEETLRRTLEWARAEGLVAAAG